MQAEAGQVGAFTRGTVTAILAALAFGLTTPVIARAGADAGPFSVAALLYLGAALASMILGAFVKASGPAPSRREAPRIIAMALVGAALAPTLLAWGIQRTGAVAAALALNFEAVFSIVLARAFFKEAIGVRVALAMIFTLVGGALVALSSPEPLTAFGPGLFAVTLATLAWAVDNTLSRPLADFEPGRIVAAKGLLGATVTSVLALANHERWPAGSKLVALLLCGATGYGLSLRLYLIAQRRLGAGRTASIFAFAPLVGAALAWALGERGGGAGTLAGAAAFAVGIVLHATEHHGHPHEHLPTQHTHAHRHDDGHHQHAHESQVEGEHTHAHSHEHLVHEHEHPPDLHHTHTH